MFFDSVFDSQLTLIVGGDMSGKSTLAQSLGVAALERGFTVGIALNSATGFSDLFKDYDVLIIDPLLDMQMLTRQMMQRGKVVICVSVVPKSDVDFTDIPTSLFHAADNVFQTKLNRVTVIKARQFRHGDTFPVQFVPGDRRYIEAG